MALRFSSWRAHWCRTHRQSCLLVVNATCPRHSRARVGFLGLLRLLLQLLALDHPQLLGQLLGQVLGQLVGFAAEEQAHGLAKRLGQRGRVGELARRLRAGAAEPRHRGGRAGKEQRRGGAAEPPSSASEACARQEGGSSLTFLAGRRAVRWGWGCQKDGGQRRRALFSSSLMCAEPIHCWSAESQSAARCAERVEMRCGRVWRFHGGPGRVWNR